MQRPAKQPPASAARRENHSIPPHLLPLDPVSSPENPRAVDNAEEISSSSTLDSLTIDGAEEDEALRGSVSLSREEVLRRRHRRVRQLFRFYGQEYWALMEEARVLHRNYYWEFGSSPFVMQEADPATGDCNALANGGEGMIVAEAGDSGKKKAVERAGCVFAGCKSMAMPLTKYCYSHILADPNQTLYKACSYSIKSNGQIFCNKPVLRSVVPSFCPLHFQKAQKHLLIALKKAGLNVSSSSRPAPKFHMIIAAYVHQIQAKRRRIQSATAGKDVKNEMVS